LGVAQPEFNLIDLIDLFDLIEIIDLNPGARP
jgi:hypothetical protein